MRLCWINGSAYDRMSIPERRVEKTKLKVHKILRNYLTVSSCYVSHEHGFLPLVKTLSNELNSEALSYFYDLFPSDIRKTVDCP